MTLLGEGLVAQGMTLVAAEASCGIPRTANVPAANRNFMCYFILDESDLPRNINASPVPFGQDAD
jgi:hypothetical protein